MKKSSLYLSALALMLAGCSSEEPGNPTPDEGATEGTTSFITIQLMAAPTTNLGRADNGVYENGTESENDVTSVRFFFFDGMNNPIGVKKSTSASVPDAYDSYLDWVPTVIETGDAGQSGSIVGGETVEKRLTATLTINLAGKQLPSKILAVVNPTQAVLGLANSLPAEDKVNGPSLSKLQGVVTDFLTGLTEKNFVMSNSVYADNGEIVYTTPLSEGHFKNSAAEAENNPVVIYVERVLARVDMGLDQAFLNGATQIDGVGTVFKVGEIEVNDTTLGGEKAQIYAKLLGWNVTTTTSQSRLIKDIDAGWTDAILGTGMPWNTADYHRSFWAINPDPKVNPGFNYRYGDFGKDADTNNNNYTPAQAYNFPTEANKYTTTYLQENAAPFTNIGAKPTNASQVIVAAQLVDANGELLSLAEWGYKKYTVEGLKNRLADVLRNLYSVTEGEIDGVKQKVYTAITPEQITFQYEAPDGTVPDKEKYWVYAVLTDDAAALTWQLGKEANTGSFANAAAVNVYIRDMVNHVMIWRGGMTYYFFDIRHLGVNQEAAGYYGIVRNHIYRSTINSITGLGVPVYDPDQVIIPEESAPNDFTISAELRILQWRVVSHGYDLSWE